MKLTLAENIKMFRKQKKMTQEKLAEALGVTVGAVYKWEAGLSYPELGMIVELADFFDTSVDVLIGYKMKDNRLEATIDNLSELSRTLDPSALSEAEKALAKYPHSFKIVYACANGYLIYGATKNDPKLLRRSLELLEQSIVLLPQNTEPRISKSMIAGDMAIAYFLLDEKEIALELLKQNNAGGIFNDLIGTFLSILMDRPEEAVPYLEESFLSSVSSLIEVIAAYVFLYKKRKDWNSALSMTTWGIEFLTGLKIETEPDVMDRILAQLLAEHAYAQAASGMRKEAAETLQKARHYADRFDSTPNYGITALKFVDKKDHFMIFDILGEKANEGIEKLLELLDDQQLTQVWQEMDKDEK